MSQHNQPPTTHIHIPIPAVCVIPNKEQEESKSKEDLKEDNRNAQEEQKPKPASEISLELLKSEIRMICFLDLIHNLLLIFCLLYFLVLVGKKLHELVKSGKDTVLVNAFKIPRASMWGLICGIVITFFTLIGEMWIIIRLRRATYPRDRFSNKISIPAYNYRILNSILVVAGYICNFSFFVYYPYPEHHVGVFFLISNCFRAVCTAVVSRHVDQIIPSQSRSNSPQSPALAVEPPSVPTIVLNSSSQSTTIF